MEREGIPVGSGYLYETTFDGTNIPEDDVLETEENRLGYIEKGATLNYKTTYKTFKDDMGRVGRTVLTDDEATLKLGLISWIYSKLEKILSTCRVTEKANGRTLKIGGIANGDNKQHIFRFVHPDSLLGDVRLTIIGTNTAGLTLQYTKDGSTNVEPEITAEPCDDEGTLIILDITDPESLGALTVTSIAGTTTGTTKITVTPSLTAGNSYKYKTGSSVTSPVLNDTSASYTVWNGTADITATTGNTIVVVETDASGLIKKTGSATVTSKV